ncbi:hypothetical protein CAEBREN_01092 [Caenorhabditis brenneri]|uniref:Uncharacterized protein n=1 Tax=Caenorhabditis brenneri TaxID=135651 RepID=G0PC28_CAEBE|nr:hypothetical protein CAEBREN_01092 [Caenorhabditis brenneri]
MGHTSVLSTRRISPRGSPPNLRRTPPKFRKVLVLKEKRPAEIEDPVMDELLLSSKLKRVDSATGCVSPRVASSDTLPIPAPTTPRQAQKAPKTPYVILPACDAFEKFRSIRRVSVDIGGTLIKVVYSSVTDEELPEESLNGNTRKYAYEDGKRVLVNFKKFTDLDRLINFLKEIWTDRKSGDTIHCTGGGSYKYSEIIMKELGVRLQRTDEMRSLIFGVNFLLSTNVDERYFIRQDPITMRVYLKHEGYLGAMGSFLDEDGKLDD